MPYFRWAPYVPVAQRRAKARRKMDQLRKKGQNIQPVEIEGRTIAKTFWGKAWCDQMEALGDFANRLPRGRTYVRNGSVCHLAIEKGAVRAMVSGSSLYQVKVTIDLLKKKRWRDVKTRCTGRIGSLLELLQGKLSAEVMQTVTHPSDGLFPSAKEIRLACSCPDWAVMCKHVAAVLYGVGARLDEQPDLLFRLRGVHHEELIESGADLTVSGAATGKRRGRTLDGDDLSEVFGIELADDTATAPPSRSARKKPPRKRTTKKTAAAGPKRTTKKKAVVRKTPKKSTSHRQGTASSTLTIKKRAVKKRAVKKRAVKKRAVKKRAVKKRAAKKKPAAKNTKQATDSPKGKRRFRSTKKNAPR